MKQVKEMPEEGQFVAVWENDECIWSVVLKREDFDFVYDRKDGHWMQTDLRLWRSLDNATFFIYGD